MKMYDELPDIVSSQMRWHLEAAKLDKAAGVEPQEHSETRSMWMDLASKASEAVVFDVSNVSQYIAEHPYQENNGISVLPPFDVVWWESAAHKRKHQGRKGALSITQRRHDDKGWEVQWINLIPNPDSYRVGIGPSHKLSMFPLATYLDDQGRIDKSEGDDGFRYGDAEARMFSIERIMESGQSREEAVGTSERMKRNIRSRCFDYWMACNFAHCQNVAVQDGEMPPHKVRRRQEKKINRELTQFKVLVIDPSLAHSQRADVPRQPISEGSTVLHIVRGNFAVYTDDKPLFGKYTGTFWRPAHVRGSAEAGTVYKDYKVKPPKS